MKKTIALFSLAASAALFSSCGVTDFAPCIWLQGEEQQECVTGILADKVCTYLTESGTIDTMEEADKFAGRWATAQRLIQTAQTMGVKIPTSVTKPYNKTLQRMRKHNYFGSTDLAAAMDGCEYL